MALPTLGPPALKLRDGAPAPRAEEQHGAAVRRRHLPELRSKALVVRVGLAPALPRQAVDLPGLQSGLDALLGLHLQIKLHGLLHALAARIPAAARARAATDVGERRGGGEEEDEGQKVGKGEVAEERRGVGEEERDVREVGGDEKGAGEEDEDEDEEVESGGGAVLAEGGVRVRV